jgi:hypothetical protein
VFGTGPTIGAPTVTGGTHTAITGLGIRSTGTGAFDLQIVNTENLTANRALTITLNNVARTLNLGGNLTTGGALTTAAAFTTSGANALTLTTTGSTNVTLPLTGTLSTLAGTETFTNKTLTSPRIGTAILDTNGNELATLTATGSAVNEISLANAATGSGPTIGVSGGDANANLNVNAKGTGRVVIKGYPYTLEVNTTTVGNVGAGTDNLMLYTVPINSLAANGDRIEGVGIGNVSANDNDKTIILSVGGTAFSTGPLDLDLARGWRVEYTIIRISSTSVLVSVQTVANALNVDSAGTPATGGNGFHGGAATSTVAVSNLAANTLAIQFQGVGTADNDVVQNAHVVELIQR